MILLIASKELTEQLRDRRMITLGVMIGTLQILALLFCWHGYRQRQYERQETIQIIRKQWLQQGEKDPHSAAHYGIYVFEPRSPLALIDTGIAAYTGESLFLEAHRQNQPRYRPAQDRTALTRFGELTAAAMIRIFVPLLLVLACYNAIVGEREQGTYRLALAQGIKSTELIAGKILGIAGGLSILCLPGIAISGLIIASVEGTSPEIMKRWALLLLVYALYASANLSGALAISALCRSSRISLLILSFFWVIGTIAGPRLVTDLAQAVYPTPSVYSFQRRINNELSGGETGHDQSESTWKKFLDETLTKYKVNKIEDLPFNYAGYSLQKMEESDSKVYKKNYDFIKSNYRRQENIINRFSILIPSISLNSISSSISSTDLESHLRFTEDSEIYRQNFVRFLNNYITYRIRFGDKVKVGEEVFSMIPEFSPSSESLSQVFRRQYINLIILFLWSAVGLSLAMLFTVKIQP